MAENRGEAAGRPKARILTESETATSVDGWINTIQFLIEDTEKFRMYVEITWIPQDEDPLRGFKSSRDGLTAHQKTYNLTQMLRWISTYAPSFLAHDIITSSTSLDSVYGIMKDYYGIRPSETKFIDLLKITLEPNERPERLYQRIRTHMQENLLKKGGKISHNGQPVQVDEKLSPTVERWVVLHWMQLIHSRLPQLVARTFAADLQKMSLKDIQPMIRDGIPQFLQDLQNDDLQPVLTQALTFRSGRPKTSFQRQSQKDSDKSSNFRPSFSRECCYCKAEGRPFNHPFARCNYVCRVEKRKIAKAFSVAVEQDESDDAQGLGEDFETLTVNHSDVE